MFDLDEADCAQYTAKCWNYQLTGTPAGWKKGKKLYYLWQHIVDGQVVENATDQCDPYTDGNTCRRHSPRWDYTQVNVSRTNHIICIRMKAYQLYAAAEANEVETRCFETRPGTGPV